MSEIRPEIVNGEPICDSGCPAGTMGMNYRMVCHTWNKASVLVRTPCIPGLRQQRDNLRNERDEARREVCELDSWFEIAEDRDWDCPESEEK